MKAFMAMTAFAVALHAAPVVDDRKLDALAQVESNRRDRAVGSCGEVSRYQLLPSIWRAAEREIGFRMSPTNAADAKVVASLVWRERVVDFEVRRRRSPSPFELYVLWNAPAQLRDGRKVSRKVAERAMRYAATLGGKR